MSKERELLRRISSHSGSVIPTQFIYEIQELLAQPEAEQEPVAWITEWVQRYRYDSTPIIDRRVSFTKGNVPPLFQITYHSTHHHQNVSR